MNKGDEVSRQRPLRLEPILGCDCEHQQCAAVDTFCEVGSEAEGRFAKVTAASPTEFQMKMDSFRFYTVRTA